MGSATAIVWTFYFILTCDATARTRCRDAGRAEVAININARAAVNWPFPRYCLVEGWRRAGTVARNASPAAGIDRRRSRVDPQHDSHLPERFHHLLFQLLIAEGAIAQAQRDLHVRILCLEKVQHTHQTGYPAARDGECKGEGAVRRARGIAALLVTDGRRRLWLKRLPGSVVDGARGIACGRVRWWFRRFPGALLLAEIVADEHFAVGETDGWRFVVGAAYRLIFARIA